MKVWLQDVVLLLPPDEVSLLSDLALARASHLNVRPDATELLGGRLAASAKVGE